MRANTNDRTLGIARTLAAMSLGVLMLSGCGITRTETDYWTITDRDTTSRAIERLDTGMAGNNGILFPSARTTDIDRHTIQHDSTYDRKYPNFLRAGGIETAGLIGSSSMNGVGPGLFGIFALFDTSQIPYRNYGTVYHPTDDRHPQNTTGNQTFKGWMVRLMPYEFWLRWFNDAPDWTLGWSPFELLAPDEDRSHWLMSTVANIYLRKRFYLRDRIPYVIVSPFAGISVVPSLYANVGGELTVGSLAGLNLRAYAGFAAGSTWQTQTTGLPTLGPTVKFPYLGLGISMMDFINRPEETEREWKDYVHSGINVNLVEASLLKFSQDYPSIWSTIGMPFSGLQMKVANIEIPLPFGNDHFWAGTSLIDWMAPGLTQQGLGVLPLRVGYRQYIFAEDLMCEPFAELSYYPSSFVNVGARLKLDTWSGQNIGITAGYVSGSSGNFSPNVFNSVYPELAADLSNFSAFYVGVTVYIQDHNYTPERVHAMHESEH